MRLPEDPTERKRRPIFSGLIKYFPLALAQVAYISFVGNEQHSPGQPLHWDRSKSKDQLDALARHLTDVAIEDQLGHRLDEDTLHALAQVAWRALAELQLRLEEASLEFGDGWDQMEQEIYDAKLADEIKEANRRDFIENPATPGRAAKTVKVRK